MRVYMRPSACFCVPPGVPPTWPVCVSSAAEWAGGSRPHDTHVAQVPGSMRYDSEDDGDDDDDDEEDDDDGDGDDDDLN